MTEPPPTVQITLNGEPQELPAGLSVTALLAHLQIHQRAVAVERNRKVVRRAEHDQTLIAAGDTIEIVSFVGGG